MKDNSLYELTIDNKQLTILNKALSDYICWQYDGIDLDIVDIPTTTENIKVAQDMKAVINYQLGKALHTPKQTSNTSLMWCKEIDLDIQEEQFDQYNGDYLQTNAVVRSLSSVTKWIEDCSDEDFMKRYPENKLQDLPLYRKPDEQRQKGLNDSVEYAKQCLDTFLKNQPKYDIEGGILSKAWNNVKERHWDTIKRMGDK